MSELWSSPVRYVECDQQGVVFNAHHMIWADEASTLERVCCVVRTTYVATVDGRPVPWPDDVRAALTAG